MADVEANQANDIEVENNHDISKRLTTSKFIPSTKKGRILLSVGFIALLVVVIVPAVVVGGKNSGETSSNQQQTTTYLSIIPPTDSLGVQKGQDHGVETKQVGQDGGVETMQGGDIPEGFAPNPSNSDYLCTQKDTDPSSPTHGFHTCIPTGIVNQLFTASGLPNTMILWCTSNDFEVPSSETCVGLFTFVDSRGFYPCETLILNRESLIPTYGVIAAYDCRTLVSHYCAAYSIYQGGCISNLYSGGSSDLSGLQAGFTELTETSAFFSGIQTGP